MASVLVVEQTPVLRALLARLLAGAGHDVVALEPGTPPCVPDVAVVGTAHPAVLAPLRRAGVPVVVVTPVREAAPGVRVLVRPAARVLLDEVAAAAAPAEAADGYVLPLAG